MEYGALVIGVADDLLLFLQDRLNLRFKSVPTVQEANRQLSEKAFHLLIADLEYLRSIGQTTWLEGTGGFADVPDAKWSARAVIRILQEETYTGVLLQGRQETHNHKLKDTIFVTEQLITDDVPGVANFVLRKQWFCRNDHVWGRKGKYRLIFVEFCRII